MSNKPAKTKRPWQGLVLAVLFFVLGIYIIANTFVVFNVRELPYELFMAFGLLFIAFQVLKGKIWAVNLSLAVAIFCILGFGSGMIVDKTYEAWLFITLSVSVVVIYLGVVCARSSFYA